MSSTKSLLLLLAVIVGLSLLVALTVHFRLGADAEGRVNSGSKAMDEMRDEDGDGLIPISIPPIMHSEDDSIDNDAPASYPSDDIDDDADTDSSSRDDVIDVRDGRIDEMSEALCARVGGHWNACSSPCRGQGDDVICIQVCEAVCECGGIAGFACPSGYSCDYNMDVVDALGVCRKNGN